MPSHQDPVLGYRVGAPYAVRVYDAAPAPKNKVLLQGPLRKVYSILNVYEPPSKFSIFVGGKNSLRLSHSYSEKGSKTAFVNHEVCY